MHIFHNTISFFIPLIIVAILYLGVFKAHTQEKKQITEQTNYTTASYIPEGDIPDFSKIADTPDKKRSFFQFMKPLIENENTLIIKRRKSLVQIFNNPLPFKDEKITAEKIAQKYNLINFRIYNRKDRCELLARVDIIPVQLALIQSANETAWGTSRFARLGNNMFGQWCFSDCQGIVPERRDKGATHEIAKYMTINESVRSYMHNLNTGKSYTLLRNLRQKMRNRNQIPDPVILAGGLTNYSSLGEKYVSIITSMIKTNKKYM